TQEDLFHFVKAINFEKEFQILWFTPTQNLMDDVDVIF
ncbi:unnamed protein product, partial [marine sediment metagenome]